MLRPKSEIVYEYGKTPLTMIGDQCTGRPIKEITTQKNPNYCNNCISKWMFESGGISSDIYGKNIRLVLVKSFIKHTQCLNSLNDAYVVCVMSRRALSVNLLVTDPSVLNAAKIDRIFPSNEHIPTPSILPGTQRDLAVFTTWCWIWRSPMTVSKESGWWLTSCVCASCLKEQSFEPQGFKHPRKWIRLYVPHFHNLVSPRKGLLDQTDPSEDLPHP